MKTSNKILLGVAAVAVAGIVVYAATHSKKTNRMREQVADEGYETAHDVLFPNKGKRDRKLQYGPVLPA